MRIGLRTIKTVLSATFALSVATLFGLEYAPTAAIIAILSVSGTKKSTIQMGISRLWSLTIALSIAVILFTLIGSMPWVFGLFLLLFIPLAVLIKAEDGIVVSSVLATHLLIADKITIALIWNEYLLMILGVGFALIANAYMPDLNKILHNNQKELEAKIRLLVKGIVNSVRNNKRLDLQLVEVKRLLDFAGENIDLSEQAMANKIFSKENFHFDYFRMRQIQLLIFQEILEELHQLEIEPRFFSGLAQLFLEVSKTFNKDNDGEKLSIMVDKVFEDYRQMPLPETRAEFELRAGLYRVLQLIKTLIDVKRDFSKQI